jgi:hypothetical protein
VIAVRPQFARSSRSTRLSSRLSGTPRRRSGQRTRAWGGREVVVLAELVVEETVVPVLLVLDEASQTPAFRSAPISAPLRPL